jgi:hypothetical protein
MKSAVFGRLARLANRRITKKCFIIIILIGCYHMLLGLPGLAMTVSRANWMFQHDLYLGQELASVENWLRAQNIPKGHAFWCESQCYEVLIRSNHQVSKGKWLVGLDDVLDSAHINDSNVFSLIRVDFPRSGILHANSHIIDYLFFDEKDHLIGQGVSEERFSL